MVVDYVHVPACAVRLLRNPSRDSISTITRYDVPTDPGSMFPMGCSAYVCAHRTWDMCPYGHDCQRCFFFLKKKLPRRRRLASPSIFQVYALYNRNRRLLFVLVLLFVSGNVFGTALFVRVFSAPVEYNPRCEILHVNFHQAYFLINIPPFCLDCITLILTIKRVLLLNRQPRRIPMLKTIIIDGTWMVFIVWSSLIGATIFAAYGSIWTGYIIANSWTTTFISFAVTRTVLNVRRYNTSALQYSNEVDTRLEECEVDLTAQILAEETLTLWGQRSVP